MNITTKQLQAIRAILNKEDREAIAEQAERSPRTVEAVLQGNRVSDDIERLAVKQAKANIARLGQTIARIEAKNLANTITLEEYQELRKNQLTTGEEYNRYMDVYLDLVHVKFTDLEGLWEHLHMLHPDIIARPFWCVSLFIRLLGVSEERAVAFYNNKK